VNLKMDLSQIEWESNEGGVVTIGGSRRGILFGELGPKHECFVPYFEITPRAFTTNDMEQMFPGEGPLEARLLGFSLRFPTEGEWELAFRNQQLNPTDGIEILVDRIPDRGYWGQPTDGRPKGPKGLQSIRDWSIIQKGKPKSGLLFEEKNNTVFRLVRQEKINDEKWNNDGNPLPMGPDPIRRFVEEVMIATILGIIPSFIWAFFNASQGYIREGWPGLVLGGLFIGAFSAIFWRPPYSEFKREKQE
tara:strand:+ start:170 stop:913 length:744 start_codon:yes stop_codon:yes gene_type:complete